MYPRNERNDYGRGIDMGSLTETDEYSSTMTSPLRWETIDSEVSYSCDGFDVVTDSVKLPEGSITEFDYVSEPPSVGIVPITHDERIVLIEEWRQAVKRVNFAIPIGGVEPEDGTIIDSAERELREETGYVPETVESILTIEPANGFADSVTHLFRATGCRRLGDQDLDTDESIRVIEMDPDAVYDLVRNGEIRDCRTVAALGTLILKDHNLDES